MWRRVVCVIGPGPTRPRPGPLKGPLPHFNAESTPPPFSVTVLTLPVICMRSARDTRLDFCAHSASANQDHGSISPAAPPRNVRRCNTIKCKGPACAGVNGLRWGARRTSGYGSLSWNCAAVATRHLAWGRRRRGTRPICTT